MGDISLDDIGLRHGTDKASSGHGYLAFYEQFFSGLRQAPITLLEIGVLEGQSLRMWAEYFPNAKIVGVDIGPKARRHATDRIAIEIADQSDAQQLVEIARKHGPFDIVIEDGSHMCGHQITSLRTLFPFVTDKGYYVVEDLHTNYGALLAKYRGDAPITCADYLKRWQDLIVGAEQIRPRDIDDPFLRKFARKVSVMAFHERACLIHKDWFESSLTSSAVLSDAARAAALPVKILAHLSFIGDVTVDDGCVNFLKDGGARRKYCEIQGFSLSSGLGALECKAQFQDGEWSEWAPEGAFVGSRGQSRLLRGLAVRVRPEAADRYEVRTVGLFRQAPAPLIGFDGAELSGRAETPLHAIQIDLTERAQ